MRKQQDRGQRVAGDVRDRLAGPEGGVGGHEVLLATMRGTTAAFAGRKKRLTVVTRKTTG